MDRWDQRIRQKVKLARPYQPKKDWAKMEQLLDADEKSGVMPLLLMQAWPYLAAACVVLVLLIGWRYQITTPDLPYVEAEGAVAESQVELDPATSNSASHAPQQETKVVAQGPHGNKISPGAMTEKKRSPSQGQLGGHPSEPSGLPFQERLTSSNAPSLIWGDLVPQSEWEGKDLEPSASEHQADDQTVFAWTLSWLGSRDVSLEIDLSPSPVEVNNQQAEWWENLLAEATPLPQQSNEAKTWAVEMYAGGQSSLNPNAFVTNMNAEAAVTGPDVDVGSAGLDMYQAYTLSESTPIPVSNHWSPSIGVSVLRSVSPKLRAGLALDWSNTFQPLARNVYGTVLLDGQYVNLRLQSEYRFKQSTTPRLQPYLSGGLGVGLTQADLILANVGVSALGFSLNGGGSLSAYKDLVKEVEVAEATDVTTSELANRSSQPYALVTQNNKQILYASGTVGIGTHVKLTRQMQLRLGSDILLNRTISQSGSTNLVSDPMNLLFRLVGGLQLNL